MFRRHGDGARKLNCTLEPWLLPFLLLAPGNTIFFLSSFPPLVRNKELMPLLDYHTTTPPPHQERTCDPHHTALHHTTPYLPSLALLSPSPIPPAFPLARALGLQLP